MLVSGGRAASVITSQLSKPTMATSAGHGEAALARARRRRRGRSGRCRRRGRRARCRRRGGGRRPRGPRLPTRGRRGRRRGARAGRRRRGRRASPRARRRTASKCSGPVTWAMRRRPRAARWCDGELGPALVVGEEAERVGVVGLAEDVDDGEAVGEGADGGALVGAAGGDDEAVDALAEELVEVLALARGVVGGVAHEDGDAGVGEALLQRLDDRDGEAAEAVVGDDADGARARAAQAVGEVVRAVADLAWPRRAPGRGSPAAAARRRSAPSRRCRSRRRRPAPGRGWSGRCASRRCPCYFTAPAVKPAT